MNRRLTLKRCPADKVAHRRPWHELLAMLFGLAATSGTASARLPPVRGATPKGAGMLAPGSLLDQGQTGTCHAHSAVGMVECATGGQGMGYFGSPKQVASCVYADQRSASIPIVVGGGPVTLPVLQDNGADLQDDDTAIAGWGLAPFSGPTSDGRVSDVENDPPDNSFPEPDVAQLEKAVTCLGEYSIPVDSNAAKAVALCIDTGVPVQVGFYCDSAFQSLSAGAVCPAPNTNDTTGGGHAVYIYGYRTAADGSLEFRIRNSWGTSWCEGGDGWMSQAWLEAAWELFPGAFRLSALKEAA